LSSWCVSLLFFLATLSRICSGAAFDISSVAGHPRAPLAFTFIAPSDIASSPDLLPPYAPQRVTNSPTFSPSKPERIVNYQDSSSSTPLMAYSRFVDSSSTHAVGDPLWNGSEGYCGCDLGFKEEFCLLVKCVEHFHRSMNPSPPPSLVASTIQIYPLSPIYPNGVTWMSWVPVLPM